MNNTADITQYYGNYIKDIDDKISMYEDLLSNLRLERERADVKIKSSYYMMLASIVHENLINIVLTYLAEGWCNDHGHYIGHNCVKCPNDSEWILNHDIFVAVTLPPGNGTYHGDYDISMTCKDKADQNLISYWSNSNDDNSSITNNNSISSRLGVLDLDMNSIFSQQSFVIPRGSKLFYLQDQLEEINVIISKKELKQWCKLVSKFP